jgi:hypothetical protein
MPARCVSSWVCELTWVHWFNHNRLHSSIGYATPLEHETEYYRHNPLPRQPLTGELSLH